MKEKSNIKIHFIGIGGIGMSALAKYCKSIGCIVQGSDSNFSDEIRELTSQGIKVFIDHDRKNVKGVDVFIYSSAISKNNPEYQFAIDNKKTLLKRSQLLFYVMKNFDNKIAVAGCHGKTTSSLMIAHIFKCASKEFTSFIGGETALIKNFYSNNDNSKICLVEACEYKKNFLDLKPNVTLITNVDNDHMDCYKDLNDLVLTYKEFIDQSLNFINADDDNSLPLVNTCSTTYGISNKAMYQAKNLKENSNFYSFNVYEYGINLGKINLKIKGIHNVYNALGAISIARKFNISFYKIKKALETFYGAKRRDEIIFEDKNNTYIVDYAHHPNEISATLKNYDKNNTLVIFQPHTYSRTKLLMEDFITSLKDCNLIIYQSYSAREEYDVNGSAYTLYKKLLLINDKVDYADDEKSLFLLLKSKKSKYKNILFLGAGNIYLVAKKYVNLI